MWYALITPREELVHRDLLSAGIDSVRLTYVVRSWNPRKSIVVDRHHSLLEGYLLVANPQLKARLTRHRFWYCTGADGEPLRVPEAEEFIYRCESGEFDVDLTRGSGVEEFDEGTEVLVEMLGLTGIVTARRRHRYEVELDGGQRVRVARGGLVLA